jgi:hypothetical protein
MAAMVHPPSRHFLARKKENLGRWRAHAYAHSRAREWLAQLRELAQTSNAHEIFERCVVQGDIDPPMHLAIFAQSRTQRVMEAGRQNQEHALASIELTEDLLHALSAFPA